MISFLYILYQAFKRFRTILSNAELRGLLLIVVVIILLGTIFYVRVESWKFIDALYFTVITLTTIGYGDFVPHTTLGKVFTIFYVFVGLGLLAMFISSVAEQALEESRKKKENIPME